jgi:mevalonate kinase
MEITKSQKRLLILLGVVLLYAIYDFTSNMDTYLAVYSGKKVVTQTEEKTSSDAKPKQASVPHQTAYLEKWGRDPFYKRVVQKKSKQVKKKKRTTHFILQAISMKDNSSIAIINDKIVKLGDIISGYTLKKIEKKRVVLSDGNKTLVLKLATY